MTEHANIMAVQRAFAALGASDVKAFLDCWATDCVYSVPGPTGVLPWAGTMQGKTQLKTWFEMALETLVFEKFEPHRFLVDGDIVVVLASERYFVRNSPEKVIETDIVLVYTVRDGKLASCREHFDTGAQVAVMQAGCS